jgi:hypothetical protein
MRWSNRRHPLATDAQLLSSGDSDCSENGKFFKRSKAELVDRKTKTSCTSREQINETLKTTPALKQDGAENQTKSNPMPHEIMNLRLHIRASLTGNNTMHTQKSQWRPPVALALQSRVLNKFQCVCIYVTNEQGATPTLREGIVNLMPLQRLDQWVETLDGDCRVPITVLPVGANEFRDARKKRGAYEK